MSTPLQVTGIAAPGFYGLNLQQSSVALAPTWATVANNAVIGNDGRIEARQGWIKKTSSSLGAYDIQTVHEYIKNSGVVEILAAANNNIYKASADLTTLTSIYSTSLTANLWKMVNFNGYVFMVQGGQTPLRYDGTNCVLLSSVSGFGDSSDAVIGTLKPNEALAAYGRMWYASTSTNSMKVWWSDTLAGHILNSGTAGSIDLNTVLTNGVDSVVALAAFNGALIIFLKDSILIYNGAEDDPTNNLLLVEHIKGIGCIARDSVVDIGTDIFFLSNSGVRSLSRTIQQKSMPIGDISINVRDELAQYYGETANKIKGAYSQKYGFYMLNFPTYSKTFVFDVRSRLEDGSARVTTWDNINPKSILVRQNQDIIFGQTGVLGQYGGYDDNLTTYTFTYSTAWLDYEKPYNYKILKRFYTLLEAGGNHTVTYKWAVDYKATEYTIQTTTAGVNPAEFGVDEYNIAEYGYGYAIENHKKPMSHYGVAIRFTIEVPIENIFRLKKYQIYAKVGREV